MNGSRSAPGGPPPDCPGCSLTVRLAPGEVERITAEYFAGRSPELAGEGEYSRRLAICASCPDLRYGSTCRFCGCLVEVRSRIRGKSCPSPLDRWAAVAPPW